MDAAAATDARGTVSHEPVTPSRAHSPAGWMPEVQGLRTLALLLVATFHIWFDRVSGGVDIFLLVSAFLMTRSLLGRLERGEPLLPLQYIAKRFGRLMPLSVVVAALILAGSLVALPVSQFGGYVEQFFASTLYVENRWLQNTLVDYFGQGTGLASPFQHYWSLAVQAQVFVLWPLVFAAVALAMQSSHVRRLLSIRTLCLWVFGTILVAGLAWSTIATAINQQHAYFDLWARLWQFAAGSVLALALPYIRLGAAWRGALIWLGIAGAVSCGFLIPVEGTFPGVAALWPVVSAALIIVGAGAATTADAPTRFGGDRLLAHPALARAGGYTYALYLVHWPVLIFGMAVLRTDHPGLLEGSAYLLVSVVLAVLVAHLVERPAARLIRRRSSRSAARPEHPADRPLLLTRVRRFPWRAAGSVAALVALVAGVTSAAGAYADRQRDEAQAQAQGADLSVMGPNVVSAGAPAGAAGPPAVVAPGTGFTDDPDQPDAQALGATSPIPAPWVSGDLGELAPCEPEMLPAETVDRSLRFCQANLDDVDPASADHSVYVVGNSHAMQLAQLIDETARHEGWAVRGYLDHACQFGALQAADADWFDDAWRDGCLALWEDATADLLENRPDAVVVLASWSQDEHTELELPGLADWVADMTEAGIEVVAVRDTPRSDLHMLECAERWGFGSERCLWGTTLTAPNPAIRASIEDAGGVYVDLNPFVCPDGVCRPELGGLTVFYDDDHVTATFMRALAYTAAPTLAERLPWWPEALAP
ncbi:acyltransferase family protein [Pseudoclavibacter endophyticus]|uniref:Acyltransferase n=1 Tax=Pseudoclavibacter endophyticus TaxID=1778590 RepID=A0A6H9WMW1_9MICO|nr:acyltransferase family protein [Pseudoclavibacter endophyticus]KAB1649101.1 acyltransferase [Pseudoclavibacter endophyticus]